MKVLAYIPLHYGAEYLDAAIRSVMPYIDKLVVVYSKAPSFHPSELECPEKEWLLKAVALGAAPELFWLDCYGLGSEGEHRDKAKDFAKGYDLLLTFDADEVWEGESLKRCLKQAYEGKAHRYNIAGFINFWKSFNHYCTDGFVPGRIYNLHNDNQDEQTIEGTVYHFGYAQRREILAYKMAIHGHRDIRPGWLENVYDKWTPESRFLHPVSETIWERAQPFDKETLPDILKRHPNFSL